MTTLPIVRAARALVAVAAATALLSAGPALAQSAPSAPITAQGHQPMDPVLEVDRTVIDFGGSHELDVVGGQLGSSVQVFATTAPSTDVQLIRSAVITVTDGDQDGIISWDLRPVGTTRYYVEVDGVRTPTVTVQVRRTVTIGVRQANGVYTFSGVIRRADAGVQVTVARLDAGTNRVTGVAAARTDAAGRYLIRTRLPVGQAGYYALTAATPDLLAGRSRLYGLVVSVRPAPRPESLSLGVSRQGSRYVVSGQLTPGRSVPVTLGRIVDGRLVGIVGGRTTASGAYRFSVALPPGTHFLQVVTATAKSRVYGLVVPRPVVPVCSATSIRKSYDDSARCMFRAYERGDWAAVANYALPPVVAALREWRPDDVRRGFNWSYSGCGKPQFEDIGDFPPASSGVACAFYSNADPGEVHGVTIEFNMDRYFRAESYTTVG